MEKLTVTGVAATRSEVLDAIKKAGRRYFRLAEYDAVKYEIIDVCQEFVNFAHTEVQYVYTAEVWPR